MYAPYVPLASTYWLRIHLVSAPVPLDTTLIRVSPQTNVPLVLINANNARVRRAAVAVQLMAHTNHI